MSWDVLRVEARRLEGEIEQKLAAFRSDFLCLNFFARKVPWVSIELQHDGDENYTSRFSNFCCAMSP